MKKKRRNYAMENKLIAILKMNGNKIKFSKGRSIRFYSSAYWQTVDLHLDEIEYYPPTQLSSSLGASPIVVRGHYVIGDRHIRGSYTLFTSQEYKDLLSALENQFPPFILKQ